MALLNIIDRQFTEEKVPIQYIHKKQIYLPRICEGRKSAMETKWHSIIALAGIFFTLLSRENRFAYIDTTCLWFF